MILNPPKSNQTISKEPPSASLVKALADAGQMEIARELEKRFLGKKISTIMPSVTTEEWLLKFLTQDERMLALKEHVRKLANRKEPVLITGETGTGKELLAHALHGSRSGNFVDINCAGMPENLIESELFGHTQGAFTGAVKETTGLIAAAADGTLFLDEVGDLAYPLQAKLLRLIQENVYRQVGGTKNLPATCRIVAATHWPLHRCIASSDQKIPDGPKFRDDLYARLSTFELNTTPLRARLDDIPLILDMLDPEQKFPRNVDWSNTPLPFNVRSLQRIVARHNVLGISPFNVKEL